MIRTTHWSLVLGIAASATVGVTAQQVSVALSTASPLTLSATGVSGTSSQSIPAGPLGLLGFYSVSGGGADTLLFWSGNADTNRAYLQLTHNTIVAAGAPATAMAAAGPNEYLVELTATATAPAKLRLEYLGLATAAGVRSITVDIGDDGSVELTELSQPPFFETSVTLTNQPLPVRVMLETTATATGANIGSLNMFVTPENDLQIDQAALGCTGVIEDLRCVPGFSGSGVDFIQSPNYSTTGTPVVLVLGLGVLPVLLPAASASAPCLLLPTVDATFVMPPAWQDPINVQLPAAVRPVTFWGQAVALDPGGLRTTLAYRVIAN